MRKHFVVLLSFVIIIVAAITINAKTNVYQNTEKTDPAREPEYSKITKFLTPAWKLDKKDVICIDMNPLTCNDQLEFLIDARKFDQKELDKVVKIWQDWGFGRELKMLKNPNYKLREVAILFSFPRERRMPDSLEVVFYYDKIKNTRKDNNFDIINVRNDNTEWHTMLDTCIRDNDSHIQDLFKCNFEGKDDSWVNPYLKEIKVPRKK